MNLPLLTAAATLVISSSAFAVQTRHCPDSIEMGFNRITIASHEEIEGHARHRKYSDAMMTEALASRDRAEKHITAGNHRETLEIQKRENGRCIYRAPDAFAVPAAEARRVILYTKGGRDIFREEFELPYQRRESETFVIESTLAKYDESGVEISGNENTDFKVTVRYPCYDHKCLTEAVIGSIDQFAE